MHVRVPRRTVRLRLTLLYGGVFLLSGAVLLGMAYLLVRQTSHPPVYSVKSSGGAFTVNTTVGGGFGVRGSKGPFGFAVFRVNGDQKGGAVSIQGAQITPGLAGQYRVPPTPGKSRTLHLLAPTHTAGQASASGPTSVLAAPGFPLLTLQEAQAQARQLSVLAVQQHRDEQHRLLVDLGIALAIMAIISMGLGWLVAGRALRPLQTITKAARAISATSLHKRLSLSGPNDELRELGDTFDSLLERLERSFAAQRQFVANASHELRTPLTLQRAIVEVALADRNASVEELQATCERVLAIGEQQERMIEALLTLARSERGLERHVVFDLQAPVAEVIASRRSEIGRLGLTVEHRLAHALTSGDQRLVERLAANLVDNAIHHNEPGGFIRVATALRSGEAVLTVSNSGPNVPPDQIERLFEPFRRLGAERSAGVDGHGLGLSIVAAIASAHGAKTSVRARAEGGLVVEVRFPTARSAGGAAASKQGDGAAQDSQPPSNGGARGPVRDPAPTA
jgi:signal transduction histidine kinase